MQLAVDQFTCRIKVTRGLRLRHDVEHDLAEAVERQKPKKSGTTLVLHEASECDDPSARSALACTLKHFLDGLSVTYVPSIVEEPRTSSIATWSQL